jgi:ATP-dependent exoDNAse (exonuclease V) beta subunit
MTNAPDSAPASLYILNASAGAGKTFSLVLNYLTHCLSREQSDFFRHILAITFTNKAAHEMKDRVLRVLAEISTKQPEQAEMGRELMHATGLPADLLQQRAGNLLKTILHQYALLSISTIDHFNHRLIRTFSLELQLSANFNLELDTDQVYQAVADSTIDQLGEDTFLTKTVLAFVEAQMEEAKSWDMRRQLRDAVQLMLNEKSLKPLEALQKLDEATLEETRKKFVAYLRATRKQLMAIGTAALEVIGDSAFDLFRNGNRGGVPKIMAVWASGGVTQPGKNFTDSVLENKWVASGKSEGPIAHMIPELTRLGQEGLAFLENHHARYLLVQAVLKNFYGLSLTKKLHEIYTAYKERENILPISEFNRLIYQEVSEQPAPFIYERIGERYQHYFIDEFQDTSLMQWGNLRPLVRHAIAAGGSALLVGDPKQSIYRWRGGEVQQFVDLFHNRDYINKISVAGDLMETFPVHTRPLDDNYRSREEIIHFNNTLYTKLANLLSNPDNKQVYLEAGQHPKKGPGGMVALKRFEAKNKAEFYQMALDETYRCIGELLASGFAKKDITLLVRGNQEGRAVVVDFANRPEPIPVISSESLTLEESAHASFLADLVGLLLKPGDQNIRFELLTYLATYQPQRIPKNGRHIFLYQAIQKKPEDFMRSWTNWFPEWDVAYLQTLSPVELVETLMRMFHLANNPDAFVQKFLNMAHEVAAGRESSPGKLLEIWEAKASSISVSPPENMDAVRVMTIHKAKGLQFPVVIVPFADWAISSRAGEHIWVPVNLPPLEYAYLPVSKSKAEHIGGAYLDLVLAAQEASLFDAMNMLYVATTRPVERLYLYTQKTGSNISKWFKEIWEALGGQPDADTLIWGSPVAGTSPQVEEVQTDFGYHVHQKPISDMLIGRNLKTLREGSRLEAARKGRLVHRVLEGCHDANQVAAVLQRAATEGWIKADELDPVAKEVHTVFALPDFQNLLLATKHQWAERPILIPGADEKRPDKILELQDGSWAILDFKTGKPDGSHVAQVTEYAQLLREATSTAVTGYLLYIETETSHLKQVFP